VGTRTRWFLDDFPNFRLSQVWGPFFWQGDVPFPPPPPPTMRLPQIFPKHVTLFDGTDGLFFPFLYVAHAFGKYHPAPRVFLTRFPPPIPEEFKFFFGKCLPLAGFLGVGGFLCPFFLPPRIVLLQVQVLFCFFPRTHLYAVPHNHGPKNVPSSPHSIVSLRGNVFGREPQNPFFPCLA